MDGFKTYSTARLMLNAFYVLAQGCVIFLNIRIILENVEQSSQ